MAGKKVFELDFEMTLPVRGLNKDPTFCIDGARSLPNYHLSNNMSSTNTKILQTQSVCSP